MPISHLAQVSRWFLNSDLGGEGGIRTHEALTDLTAFETPLPRFAVLPWSLRQTPSSVRIRDPAEAALPLIGDQTETSVGVTVGVTGRQLPPYSTGSI